ncbi:MAG: succinate dehydrogenase [Burkholderiaceae bacterium]
MSERAGVAVGADSSADAGAALSEASIAQAKRWYWQRISAMVLAICVLLHLAVILHAVRGGLSAAEILGRTRGNWGFAMFYGVFVIACAVHVPVGIANVAEEWLGFEQRNALWLSRAFALVLLVMGLRAVVAVVV